MRQRPLKHPYSFRDNFGRQGQSVIRLKRDGRWRRIPADYLLVLLGMTCRAVLQAILTVLVARSLSRSEYGASVAVAGVAGFFSVWAGLGASFLHLRDASTLPDQWQRSFNYHFRQVALWQAPLVALSVLCAWFITSGNVSLSSLLLLAAGELIGAPAADLLVRSYQGRSRYKLMATIMCALPLVRMGLLLAFVIPFAAGFNLHIWAWIVFLSGCALATMALAVALGVQVGSSVRDISPGYAMSGVAFAMSSASSRVYADADKIILARMASMGTAGEYSLAYRMVDLLLLPVNSLIEWSARAMFQQGTAGSIRAFWKFWPRWTAVACLALSGSLTLFAIAPLLPWIFGAQYEGVSDIARWLSILPLTAACWNVVRSIANTSGQEKLAAIVEIGGALLNVILCLVLIDLWGWKGAVLATYITHMAMSVACIYAIRLHIEG